MSVKPNPARDKQEEFQKNIVNKLEKDVIVATLKRSLVILEHGLVELIINKITGFGNPTGRHDILT